MGDYPRLSPGLDPALWCTPIFHCMIALSFCNRCMDNFWGLCGCIFYHLNLAEYINWRIRRLRRGCQENISVLNLTAFVVSKNFPTMKSVRGWFHIQQRQHQRNWRLAWPDVGYWPTADTFLVSWDSFRLCSFWGGNENLWEIVASSPLLSDHSRSRPFSCAALMFIVAHEHPLELVHASYMASLKTDFLCTLISGDYSISGGERKLSSFKVEALINYLCCNFWQAMETSSPMKMPYWEKSKQEFPVWWWQGAYSQCFS